MSHFTVLVCLPGQRVKDEGFEKVLESMLAPYQENNMCDCPEEYLELDDRTDEVRKEYDEWNEPEKINMTFEEFAKAQGCIEQDGRWGYMANPNAKWDWWQLGGRWHGSLPVKPSAENVTTGSASLLSADPSYPQNQVDACQVSDLDLDEIAKQTREGAEKWWDSYQLYRSGDYDKNAKENRMLDYNIRSTALSLGILQVKQHSDLKEGDEPTPFKDDMYDVYRALTKDEFLEEYMEEFNPVQTHSALDVHGWHEPGQMGWFAYSSETPEEKMKFVKEFYRRFVKEIDSDDWLAVVDCHI
jgi:hypothetical protein